VNAFRCSAASLTRDEPIVGTASTVRAFLLVENPGPWGVDALRDARLEPVEVRDALRERAALAGVRVLLVRRPGRATAGEGRRVFAAYADPEQPWLETATVSQPRALLDLDLGSLARGRPLGLTRCDEPVFCVCTHGRHDACCAELGRPTAAALSHSHPEHTWEVSHVGGDRFAANLLVLPDGLYYGRVDPGGAPGLASRHLEGHLDLTRLRGRSGYSFAVQVAEVGLRRRLGETGRDALRLLWVRTEGDLTRLSFQVLGAGASATYAVQVRRRTEPAQQLTCRALRANQVPAYDVVDVTRAE
jgi:hypothetical protein